MAFTRIFFFLYANIVNAKWAFRHGKSHKIIIDRIYANSDQTAR